MGTVESQPKQGWRLIIVLLYTGVFLAANFWAFGQFPPASGPKGLWLYTGILSILLGDQLITPYYTKPVDAFSYAAAAGLALLSSITWEQWGSHERVAFLVAALYCLGVLLAAAFSIIAKDSVSEEVRMAANAARITADTFGNHRILFSVVILTSIYLYHRSEPRQILAIGLAWAVAVAIRPDGIILSYFRRLRASVSENPCGDVIGYVSGYQDPRIITVRARKETVFPLGQMAAVKDPHGPTRLAISIGAGGRDESRHYRFVEIDVPDNFKGILSAAGLFMNDGEVTALSTLPNCPDRITTDLRRFLGIVTTDTTLEILRLELITELPIEEGRLVEVAIRKKLVTYQVLNGITREEIVRQKNTFGYITVVARKVGAWNSVSSKFESVSWLPDLNSPVFLRDASEPPGGKEAVGYLPGTDCPIQIQNLDHLVTHNTAILGILGVGKSMLSIELIERMVKAGIRVVCLDLTDQYAKELAGLHDATHEAKCLAGIQAAAAKDIGKTADNPEDGGSLGATREAILADLDAWLKEGKHAIKIINPAAISATKQMQEPKSYQSSGSWKRGAALWSVTPVEITRIVTECVLLLLQGEMSDKARVCLVYEEAHSLVPEWNSTAVEGDKHATNGTARAILQGRKFGMGCLLITQRTANVTKTILNQCNSIFAMRTFDDTGKEFLANYIGSDYAEMLPGLKERHAVFFGKASSCENPVLIRLNDRDKFLAAFRETAASAPQA